MRPVLFYLDVMGQPYAVTAYRFFGVLAALYLMLVVVWQWRKYHRPQAFVKAATSTNPLWNTFSAKELALLCVFSTAAFFFGARLLYALLYLPQMLDNPQRLVELKLRNFSLHGGLVGVLLLWGYWSRRRQFSFPAITDSLVVHVGVAIAIMRLGCFFNGCCFGLPTQLAWGIHFPQADPNPVTRLVGFNAVTAALLGATRVLRHPTQLYELMAALFASGMAAFSRYRFPTKTGLPTALFGLVFSGGRLMVFFFRDFPQVGTLSNFVRGPVVYGLSLLFFGWWIYYIYTHKNPRLKNRGADTFHK